MEGLKGLTYIEKYILKEEDDSFLEAVYHEEYLTFKK